MNHEKSRNFGPPNPFFHGELAIWKKCGLIRPPNLLGLIYGIWGWGTIIQPVLAVDCSSVDTTDADVTSIVDLSLVFIVDIVVDVDW